MAKIENGYSVESLERGIEAAKKNIETFETAIDKERETIREYRFMIDTILRKKSEAIRNNIVIDMNTGKNGA